jgi:hypothetical protein
MGLFSIYKYVNRSGEIPIKNGTFNTMSFLPC